MKKLFLLLFLFACGAVFTAAAQLPRTISYQGVLTDAAGNFIADGNHTLVIKLYDNLVAATPIFSETQAVPVVKGLFNIIIGTAATIPASLAFDRAYFLGVSVDGGLEMSPRTALSAVPYALRAAVADQAQSLSAGASGVVRSVNGQEGALTLQGGGGTTINNSGAVFTISSSGGGGTGIQGVQSSDGSLDITNPNGPTANLVLAPDAVRNSHIINDAVTASKIASGHVVKSLRVEGSTFHDDVTLAAGSNVTLTPSGSTITIAATGGGGGGITTLQNGNNTLDITNPNGPLTTVNIKDSGVGTTQLARGAVTPAKLSGAGAASGQVLTYDGSIVTWATPAGGSGLALPFASTVNSTNNLFSLTNSGPGRAGYFRTSDPSATASALYGMSNSTTSSFWVAGVEGASPSNFGVIGRGGTGAAGIWGGIVTTSGGAYSAGSGVTGFSDVGHGVAGITYFATSAGVNGFASGGGIGVRGASSTGKAGEFTISDATNTSNALEGNTAGSGAAVSATYTGSGVGTALLLGNGAIRVSGSNRAAFIHTATVANKTGANNTEIDHPLCNNNANAILLVTQQLNQSSSAAYNNSPIGVYYNPGRNRWEIFNENSNEIPTDAQFNVLVIDQ